MNKNSTMVEIPKINQIDTLHLPEYSTIKLENGIPVIILKSSNPDIIKMNIVLNAGRYQEKSKAIARTTANLLKEGTINMDSAKIAETIDFYGATVSTEASMDTTSIQVYSMGKYFNSIIPIVTDIITNPIFPEKEINKYKTRILEKLKIELSKNSVLAYRHFTEILYGKEHPYGYNTVPTDYENITKEKLLDHFNTFYTPNNCKIFISGNITEDKINILNKNIGKIKQKKKLLDDKTHLMETLSGGNHLYNNERKHQTAIRIGRRMFARSHPDYAGVYLLNTILGGYFGSRLSSNIREDKGYTYGIYSSLDMMLRDGYFIISTDVGNKYLENTITEIYKEIDLLRTELIPEDEINLVKNYIKGNFLSLINGHLNTLNLIKTVELAGLEKTFFTDFINKISEISAKELMELAVKYFDKKDLVEVRVGHNVKL